MTSIKLGDEFLRVPKLDAAGNNWVTYRDRLMWAVDARGLLKHLDGTGSEPVNPVPVLASPVTDVQTTALNQWKEDLKEWHQGEAVVKQQIAGTIPDSLFMKIRSKGSAREIWETLAADFQKRSRLVAIDLRRQLQETRLAEKGDMRVHLAQLRSLREILASMGHPPDDDDFFAIILSSLPDSYENCISAINVSTGVSGEALPWESLTMTLTDEYDRRVIRTKTGKKDDKDAAFSAAGSSSKWKGKAQGGSKKLVECFNCHKKGHMKADCWSKGGGKEGQGPKGKGKGKEKDTANAGEDKGEGGSEQAAWVAMEEWDSSEDFDSDFELFTMSDSDADAELFEMSEDEMSPLSSPFVSDAKDEDDLPDLISIADSDSEDNRETLVNLEVPTPNHRMYTNYSTAFLAFEAAMLTRSSMIDMDVDLYDSGASNHMSGDRHRFVNFEEIPPHSITAANKQSFSAIGKGDMYVVLPNNGSFTRVLLRGVLFAPAMAMTLVSISRITKAGSSAVFKDDCCHLYDGNGKLLGSVPVKDGLYRVFTPQSLGQDYAGKVAEVLTINELHRRLGHVSHTAARDMVKKGLIHGVELDESSSATPCDACEYGKMTRKPIQREREETERAKALGDVVHGDLWGPASTETIGGRRYFFGLTDEFSRFSHVYLLRSKNEAFRFYKECEAWWKTQKGVTIKRFHSDRGGEFISDEFEEHLAKQGTTHRLTTHDTPEYNGIAERLNRTLMERVRAMFHDSGLPKFLWGETLHHAVYLKNRMPTRALGDTTPFEVVFGEKPNLAQTHPWGCKVRVHSRDPSKLDGRSSTERWVGIDQRSMAHRIYFADRRMVKVERNVKFNFAEEDEVPIGGEWEMMGNRQTQSEARPMPAPVTAPEIKHLPTEEKTDEVNHQSEPETDYLGPDFQPAAPETTEETGRTRRVRKESAYVRRLREGEGVASERPSAPLLPKGLQPAASDTASLAEDLGLVSTEDYAMASVMGGSEGLEPSYEEVRQRPDWPKWLEAIKKEIASLEKNGTWTLVDGPPNANVVDAKWVFRIKKNSSGEIEKYKARLVARGFTQIHGMDYYETYAPVAKLSSFRLFLAIAARNGWPVESFDFDSAFLNGILSEDEVVYLEQPPDFEYADRKAKVLRLHKALYGLKQGARNWYEAFCKAMADLGFCRTEADHGVFYLKTERGLVILAVHVDDCMITATKKELIEEFKKGMGKKYSFTDLGPIHWLLGIKVTRNLANHSISLSQHSYIDSILARHNFLDSKPSSIPMIPDKLLSRSQSPTSVTDIARMKNVPYCEAIGALMYVAMGTRPDIAFAVSTLAQFSDNPGWAHWEAVGLVFRYLLGTKNLELVYGGDQNGLVGYVDADGASQDHRRAISGYVFLVDGGAVSWMSKKQGLVTLSTTEAEYVAATHAAKEALWIRRLIGEVFGSLPHPTTMYSDSKSAIALTEDGHYHARTKHIDIRYHFIRYTIEAGSIRLLYCATDEMTADILTKALPSLKAKHFASALGLRTV
ncbi:hypothetical protein CCMSSC00406_0009851 [Pleurotus cornucopiae]|uniref:Uncharacterized protein n=1 Tax=Pleurotus cornucopiae TaxID=5321 RepID=A0ACB7J4V4_PLECO|nr:hypothetical protein CCMSSC00406_0009851 [Pleurotus cornucopiae]